MYGGMESTQAVVIPNDNTFALDFVANGNSGGNLSNFPVAVYWKWDGNQTLGIRMETPNTAGGFPGGNGLWSFNVFCNGSSPGGLDSSGSNVTSITPISVGGSFSAASLGAYAVPVDAIEATWIQPCSGGGPFDPTQTTVYIQLTIGGDNFPSNGYRMADYLGQGGTYSTPPDFFTEGGFCSTQPLGACAELMFQIPQTFINLSPPTATNDVLTDHTVSATVETDGVPEPGVLVTFEVTSGPNAGEMSDPDSGECTPNNDCTTDAIGEVSWTYTGSKFPGTDTIVASFFDEGMQEDIDSNPVEKIWVLPLRNIPTLSEWGLIAMAGVLGIIGLMALRRRKAVV